MLFIHFLLSPRGANPRLALGDPWRHKKGVWPIKDMEGVRPGGKEKTEEEECGAPRKDGTMASIQ